jgi:hypothetical protein
MLLMAGWRALRRAMPTRDYLASRLGRSRVAANVRLTRFSVLKCAINRVPWNRFVSACAPVLRLRSCLWGVDSQAGAPGCLPSVGGEDASGV